MCHDKDCSINEKEGIFLKKWWLVFATVSIVWLFAACQSSETKEEKKEARPMDELVMSMGARPPGEFDPRKRWGLYSQSNILHSTLLKRDADMNIEGDLATDYSVSDDGLVWSFTLRDDVKFSNGEPVTIKDVLFSYQMLKEDGVHWDLSFVKAFREVDPTHLEIELKEPQSTFVAHLTEIVIVPKDHYDDNYEDQPIGSGPYRLVQWDRDEQAIFEVNPYYYGEEPYFKKFTLLFLEEDTALAAAKAGQVDAISLLPSFAEERVDGMSVRSFESNDVREVSMPMQRAGGTGPDGHPVGNDVTSDEAIRQALAIGINRQAMIDTVLEGHGKKAYSVVDQMPWWNEATVIDDTDVEGAIERLEEGGWVVPEGQVIREKDGLRASFDLYYPAADQVRTGLALQFAEMAAPLGIEVSLISSNWDEIQTKMHAHAVLYAGGRHHPHQYYTMHHPSMAGIGYGNITYYDNPIVTDYLEQAIRATSEEQANKWWKRAQWDGTTGTSMLADTPFIWLVRLDHLYLVDDTIDVGQQKVHSHGHEWSLLSNIQEWKRK